MSLRLCLSQSLALLALCLIIPFPAIAPLSYGDQGLYWNLEEGQMVNCILTWHYDFGSITAQNDTPIIGNITVLNDLTEESMEPPAGSMLFYWQDMSPIEYDSTSSWRHRISSLVLPLGNWSLIREYLEDNYTIIAENESEISVHSLFVPHPDLPATWKNQTISKSDGFFLSVTIGYKYPNETVTHFATVVRNGSIFTPTPTTTGHDGFVLTPEQLVLAAAGSLLIITVMVITKYRTKPRVA